MAENQNIRRIVTGHDENNVAKVFIDDVATNRKKAGNGAVSTLVWSTDHQTAEIAVGDTFEDMGARVLGTQPPQNGSRFAVIELPPGEPTNMHRTESIDYVICLCGKIDWIWIVRRLR